MNQNFFYFHTFKLKFVKFDFDRDLHGFSEFQDFQLKNRIYQERLRSIRLTFRHKFPISKKKRTVLQIFDIVKIWLRINFSVRLGEGRKKHEIAIFGFWSIFLEGIEISKICKTVLFFLSIGNLCQKISLIERTVLEISDF